MGAESLHQPPLPSSPAFNQVCTSSGVCSVKLRHLSLVCHKHPHLRFRLTQNFAFYRKIRDLPKVIRQTSGRST